MIFLTTGFLPRSKRLAIINRGADGVADTALETLWCCKLTSAVCQNNRDVELNIAVLAAAIDKEYDVFVSEAVKKH